MERKVKGRKKAFSSQAPKKPQEERISDGELSISKDAVPRKGPVYLGNRLLNYE